MAFVFSLLYGRSEDRMGCGNLLGQKARGARAKDEAKVGRWKRRPASWWKLGGDLGKHAVPHLCGRDGDSLPLSDMVRLESPNRRMGMQSSTRGRPQGRAGHEEDTHPWRPRHRQDSLGAEEEMGAERREQTSGMATFMRRMKESTREAAWKVLLQKVEKQVSKSGKQGRRRLQGHQRLT